jgi:hypothetical protein
MTTAKITLTRPRLAHRLLLLATGIFLVGFVVGSLWDAWWHLTRTFENDFFSPPHVFSYLMATTAGLIVMSMVFIDPVRRAFGKGFTVGFLPFEVPGALFLLGGGMVGLGFAGLVLDNFWHTQFGLNETRWSFPHAMIGSTILLTGLGVASCRLALRPHRKLYWQTVLLLAICGVGALGSWMGPLWANFTPATVAAAAQIPIYGEQIPVQQVNRIYQEWNLNRTHPLLIPLAAVWAGMTLAFLRRLDGRWWIFLLLVGLIGSFSEGRNGVDFLSQYDASVLQDPANWQPLPLFWAGVVLLLCLRLKVPERWAYGVAGLLFGVIIQLIWGSQPVGWLVVLLSVPFCIWGASLGEQVYAILEAPYERGRVLLLIFLVGVVLPFTTGVVDLLLRASMGYL